MDNYINKKRLLIIMAENIILKGINGVKVVYCRNCNSYLYKNSYLPAKKFIELFDIYLANQIDFGITPDSIHVDKTPLKTPVKRVETRLSAKALINGKVIKENITFPIRVEFRECKKCSKMKTNYFEGIFQLRNTKSREFMHIYKLILKETQRAAKNGVAITKEEQVNNGIDFYFTSQRFIQQLGPKLYKNFGGELKVNASLFTRNRQTSKDVFRVNVLLRLPDFNVSDIIRKNKKLYQVNSFSKDMIISRELSSDKIMSLKQDGDIELACATDLFKQAIILKRKPYFEILHPESFQPVRLENISLSKKDQISVFEIDDKFWAVE
jgi:NMD protein affecting ribosome stability and mRNA decay